MLFFAQPQILPSLTSLESTQLVFVLQKERTNLSSCAESQYPAMACKGTILAVETCCERDYELTISNSSPV